METSNDCVRQEVDQQVLKLAYDDPAFQRVMGMAEVADCEDDFFPNEFRELAKKAEVKDLLAYARKYYRDYYGVMIEQAYMEGATAAARRANEKDHSRHK